MPEQVSAENAASENTNILGQLFAESNRGILFDLIIFVLNLTLMQVLTSNFLLLATEANDGEFTAAFAIFLFCLGIYVLPPLGALLKRPYFHHRMSLKKRDALKFESLMSGCLFNPIFYFVLSIVIMACLNSFIMQYLFEGKEPSGNVFVPMVFAGLIFTIVQTWLVYRFFSAPKREARSAFFRSPWSEQLGDLCIFVNMILFQVMWNIFAMVDLGRVSGVTDFLGRLFLLTFIALLIYFPPRIFFLAEDMRRPLTWLTMLLANSPVIARVLFGSSSGIMQN